MGSATVAGVQLTHTLTDAQIDELAGLYRDVWWAHDRHRPDIDGALAGCLPFALVDEHGHLAGFARVVTDGVYKATIFDVIVAPAHRGTGLGQRLLDTVMEHPVVAQCRHVELQCKPDLVDFYARWGFSEVTGIVYMRRTRA